MDNNSPWYMQAGDALGLPGVAGASMTGAKVLKSLLPYVRGYGLRAVGGLAASPFSAALAGAQVMDPTEANAGEKPFYVRDPATGQMVPNPANKFDPASIGGAAPMSPMPASYPYPGIPNGMNPANPSVLSSPAANIPAPTPAPMAQTAPAAPYTPTPQTSAPVAPAYSNGGSFAKPTMQPTQNTAPQTAAPSLNSFADFPVNMPTTNGGGSFLGKLIDLPSKLGGAFGFSQVGPTFANGSAGMMGGVPFSIF